MASKSKKSKASRLAVNARRNAANTQRAQAAGLDVVGRKAPVVQRVTASDEEALSRMEEARALAEGASREEARCAGELVHFSVGHRRIAGRDGLEALCAAGGLTGRPRGEAKMLDFERQAVRRVGLLAYRECCEAAVMAIQSALSPDKTAGGGRSAPGTSDPFVAALAVTGQKGVRRTLAEAAVLERWPGGAEIRALRRVAWLGETVCAVGRGGKQSAAVTDSLVRAADLVAPIMGVQGWEILMLSEVDRAIVGRALAALNVRFDRSTV